MEMVGPSDMDRAVDYCLRSDDECARYMDLKENLCLLGYPVRQVTRAIQKCGMNGDKCAAWYGTSSANSEKAEVCVVVVMCGGHTPIILLTVAVPHLYQLPTVACTSSIIPSRILPNSTSRFTLHAVYPVAG